MVDNEDSSLTRCNAYMLDLFEKADMQVGGRVERSGVAANALLAVSSRLAVPAGAMTMTCCLCTSA